MYVNTCNFFYVTLALEITKSSILPDICWRSRPFERIGLSEENSPYRVEGELERPSCVSDCAKTDYRLQDDDQVEKTVA